MPSLALVSSSACWTCCGWVMSTCRSVRRGEQVLCRSRAPTPDRSSTVAKTSKPRASRCSAVAFPKPESQPVEADLNVSHGCDIITRTASNTLMQQNLDRSFNEAASVQLQVLPCLSACIKRDVTQTTRLSPLPRNAPTCFVAALTVLFVLLCCEF